MSESPGLEMVMTATLWSLPQAVPIWISKRISYLVRCCFRRSGGLRPWRAWRSTRARFSWWRGSCWRWGWAWPLLVWGTWWLIYILYSQLAFELVSKRYKWGFSLTKSVLSGLNNQGELLVHVLLGFLLGNSAHSIPSSLPCHTYLSSDLIYNNKQSAIDAIYIKNKTKQNI